MRVLNLDDPTTRRNATDDPVGFVAGLGERGAGRAQMLRCASCPRPSQYW